VKIDLVLAGVLLLFGLLGAMSGAIRQLAHLGGLVVAWLFARPLALLIAPFVVAQLKWPPLFTTIGCAFLLFFVLYALTVFALRFVLGKLFPDGEKGSLNRLGGLVLGAAKAGVISFVVLSLVTLVEKHVASLWKEYRSETQNSVAVGLVRAHNPFLNLPQFKALRELAQSKSISGVAASPDLKALSSDPRLKALLEDSSIRKALESSDYGALLRSGKVLEALNDPALSEKLAKLNVAGGG